MAKEWKERPSSLLGVSGDSYLSYCLDEAVFMFGRHVENEMNAAEEAAQGKRAAAARQMALTNILRGGEHGRPSSAQEQDEVGPKQGFRDPASMFSKQ
jgi:hypothetical protein